MGIGFEEHGLELSLAVVWAIIAMILAIATRRHASPDMVMLGSIWFGMAILAGLAAGTFSIIDLLL
jgi:hypothetical protein